MIFTKSKLSIKEQITILEKSIHDKTDFDVVLASEGYTYDDLRYNINDPIELSNAEYQTLEYFERTKNSIPFVSFFTGAGGLDLGFCNAGFSHLASIEINPLFCETLRFNFPNWKIIGPPTASGDLREKEEIESTLSKIIPNKKCFEGVFLGGPPCQPFSIASNQRFSKNGKNFKRIGFNHTEFGNLLFDYIWLIMKFKPLVFLIENVKGLSDVDDGQQLRDAISRLSSIGYQVSAPTVLNAADFGVPQNRFRLFIIGTLKNKEFSFPQKNILRIPCYKVFEKEINGSKNHVTRDHEAKSILRYMKLSYGGRDQLGRVDRLDPNLPSKTVISGGNKGGGRSHLHPFIPRTISVRESARLQTFPDSYEFAGPVARQFTQVGNAVPPLLAFKIADAINKQFYSTKTK